MTGGVDRHRDLKPVGETVGELHVDRKKRWTGPFPSKSSTRIAVTRKIMIQKMNYTENKSWHEEKENSIRFGLFVFSVVLSEDPRLK